LNLKIYQPQEKNVAQQEQHVRRKYVASKEFDSSWIDSRASTFYHELSQWYTDVYFDFPVSTGERGYPKILSFCVDDVIARREDRPITGFKSSDSGFRDCPKGKISLHAERVYPYCIHRQPDLISAFRSTTGQTRRSDCLDPRNQPLLQLPYHRIHICTLSPVRSHTAGRVHLTRFGLNSRPKHTEKTQDAA
jgi:hypothetical protein